MAKLVPEHGGTAKADVQEVRSAEVFPGEQFFEGLPCECAVFEV
ncbi:MAG: Uncharacterised protein [Cryomorphaceae bacterium]|nr:MAG: Uncharacterised protein [Cryomorphaceae bacterium]